MRASVLIQRLAELVELYGDLDVMILDSTCEQPLRTLSRSSVGVVEDEIRIEAFE